MWRSDGDLSEESETALLIGPWLRGRNEELERKEKGKEDWEDCVCGAEEAKRDRWLILSMGKRALIWRLVIRKGIP